jgi:uncharacterized Zn finger protein
VRNGSVVDLQIAASQITALVSGSDIYEVKVEILPVAKPRWKAICEDCAGSIDSLVELLQGRLSKGVMERISQQQAGLFPSPKEIKLSCSCPDWAEMCKHVAAVLYGVGARLDQQPELLFRLRAVNEKELIASAGKALPRASKSPSAAKVLVEEDLSKLFGLDMANSTPPAKSVPSTKGRPLAKAARVPETRVTKAKPGAAKPKPAKKAAKSKAKPFAPTKPVAKKKPVAAPAKAKPVKKSASKGPAPTKKAQIASPKSSLPAAKKNAVASKAKPTRSVAKKASAAPRHRN